MTPLGFPNTSFTGLTPDVNYAFTVTAVNTLADGISVQSSEASFTAVAPAATLSVTGPTTVNEGSTGNVLTLSSGSGSNITSWQVVWTDENGNTIATDTIAGANGTAAFPSSTTPVLFAAVTAYDSSGATFTLPGFESDVIPIAPSNVQAAMASSTEIDLTWTNDSAIASGFEIYRSINGGDFEDIGSVDVNTMSFTDTGLDPSDSVIYEVAATGYIAAATAVSSKSTASPSVVTPTGLPSVVSLVTDPATDTATLKWTYQGNDASGFEIEEEDQTLGTNFQIIGNEAGEDSSGIWSVTSGITAGDTYEFRMRADHKDLTVSQYVDCGSALIQLDYAPELSVESLTETLDGFDYERIRVGWNDVLPSAGVTIQVKGPAWPGDEFRTVWYGEGGGGAWPSYYQFDDNNLPDDTSDEGYTLDPGVWDYGTYTFRIRASDIYGNPTAWSAPQSASNGEAQGGAALSLSATSNTITASWDDEGAGELLGQAADAPMEIGNGDAGLLDGSDVGGTIQHPYNQWFTGLTPGTTYEFVLWKHIAVRMDDDAVPEYAFTKESITTLGTAPIAPPATPAFARAMYDPSVPGGQINISWANSSANETGFQVFRVYNVDGAVVMRRVGTTTADYTIFEDHPVDDGPYTYAICAVNAGGDSSFIYASTAAIGGPDISIHLLAIERHLATIASAPAGASRLFWEYFTDPTNNWDITPLFRQTAHTDHNSGVIPDGQHTVTVDGRVYQDANVNYWLYGVWTRLIGIPYTVAYDLVFGHAATTTEGPFGKALWFQAGYDGTFFDAIGSAIPNVLPAQAPPAGEDTGPLGWNVGAPGTMRYGSAD